MVHKVPIDVKKMTKKYKVDVTKVIKGWKADRTDTEISQSLNVDLLKLLQIRKELEEAHLGERMLKKRT